jgi:hypothetical protein
MTQCNIYKHNRHDLNLIYMIKFYNFMCSLLWLYFKKYRVFHKSVELLKFSQ